MRFNHMELTLPPGTLSSLRGEIGRFYRDVFGWQPLDVDIVGQNALLLRVDEEVSSFVLVAESPRPMQSPGHDHLGVLLETRAEVDAVLARCRAERERDQRVEIKEYEDLVLPDRTVHAFYVKYLLPIFFDVQCMEYRRTTDE
jgi:hypothetical protein